MNAEFLLLFFLISFSNVVLGQQFFFRQYTPDEGLPSASLYNLTQDQNGFLWMTSDAEVSKFDGRNLISSPIEGLEQKEIIRLDFQNPNRLVFTTLTNQTFIYEKDSLRELDIPLYPTDSYLCSLQEDKNEHIWIVSNRVEYIVSIPKNSLFDTTKHKAYYHPKLSQPKAFHAASKDSIYLFSFQHAFKIINDTLHYVPHSIREHMLPATIGMPNKDDILVATDSGHLFFYSKKKDLFRPAFMEYDSLIQAGINYVFEDHLQNIWISTRNGLLFLRLQEDGSYDMRHLLAGSNIGVVYQDSDLHYWVTSLNNGLFFLSSLELKSYIHPRLQKISSIAVDKKNNILLGTHDGWLLELNEGFELQKESKLQRQAMQVYDIDATTDTILLATSSQIRAYDATNGTFYEHKKGTYKKVKRSSNHVTWFGSSLNMGFYDRSHIGNQNRKVLHRIRTYALYPINDKECYFGTVKGLYHYKNDTLKQILPEALEDDIRDIEILADSTFLLATQGNGLFRIRHDSIIQHLTTKNGLTSNNCKSLLLTDKYTWLATNKGLHRIDFETKEIKLLSSENGLVDDNVNCLASKGDTVIVGTNNGVFYFNENYKLDENPPKLYFSSVKVAEKDTTIIDSYLLEHHQNNIKIGFSSIQFTNAKNIEYQYKLQGLNDEWVTTTINEAQYPSLTHGNYKFMLRAKTINSDWSIPISLPFEIAKPFWKTWWFISLGVLLVGAILYCILLQYIKNKARKAKAEAQIKETQLMALRSQMNPHFLFNSLNSIQEFIILQDKRTANRYLGQFSLLMRTILNMSEKETITLRQEVDALELYLSLESMRFEEELNYTISCDPAIKLEQTFLPPMLIQPYVENAILHGLRHKNGIKKLDIEFKLAPPFLKCIITDNGIGRVKAKEIKARKKAIFPSKGMNITEKRLSLLNDAYHQNLKIDIFDLKNDAKEALGTKVIIQILLENNKN